MAAVIVTAYRCLSCEHVGDESAGSLYECSRCGTVFTQETSADGGSNRCPTDNIFGAKIADDACVECNEGEVEEIRAIEIDGELLPIDADAEGDDDTLIANALARREEEERKEREKLELRAQEKERKRVEFEAKPRVRADEVLPGDLLGYHDPNSTWDAYPSFKVGFVGPDDLREGYIRIAPPGGMGLNFSCEPGDVFALLERPEETPENEPDLAEQLRGLDLRTSYEPEAGAT